MSQQQKNNMIVKPKHIGLQCLKDLENREDKGRGLSWQEVIELEQKVRAEFGNSEDLISKIMSRKNESSFPHISGGAKSVFYAFCLKTSGILRWLARLLRRQVRQMRQLLL